MSTEQNKALVRRMWEVLSRGEVGAIEEIWASSFVDHSPGPPKASGPEGIRAGLAQYRAAVPDLQVTVEEVIAEGDKVATRETWRGTHRDGAPLLATRLHLFRVADGQIADEWSEASLMPEIVGHSSSGAEGR